MEYTNEQIIEIDEYFKEIDHLLNHLDINVQKDDCKTTIDIRKLVSIFWARIKTTKNKETKNNYIGKLYRLKEIIQNSK